MYCTSCGSPIPEGQESSCSICYGDPHWGKDNYYLNRLEDQYKQALEEYAAQEEQQYRDEGK